MRGYLMAAMLWKAAVLCSSVLLPFGLAGSETDPNHDILAVAGSIGPESSLNVDFQLDVSDNPGGSFDIHLTLPASQGVCGLDDPILNGVPLDSSQSRDGASHFVQLVFSTANSTHHSNLLVDYNIHCVDDEAAILSVRIVEDLDRDGDSRDPIGFTASYYQGPEPLLLRLSNEPLSIDPDDDLQPWIHPSAEYRVTIVPAGPIEESRHILDEEFQRLESLKVQIFDLHGAIARQERKILHLIKPNFRACDGFRCMLQKAMQKLPDLTHLISTHFRICPEAFSAQKSVMHHNDSRSEPSNPFDLTGDHDELGEPLDDMGYTQESSASVHYGSLPPSAPQREHEPTKPLSTSPHDDDRPSHHDEPEPLNSLSEPPPLHLPNEESPSVGHSYTNPQSMHPGFHHRHHVIKASAILLLLVLILGLCLRRTCSRGNCLSRFKKRRTERAARREERRAQREHCRTVRKQKWANWWNRCRKPTSTSDYEEKRTLILQQENILESAMQNDINTLRSAHDIAEEMIRAEEGRARLYYEVNLVPSRRPIAELDACLGSSRGRRSSSSSSYTQPPPMYEEELEGELTVVDGFSFTPSSTDDTPDSSVVDCSPRLSFETGTTILTKASED